MTTRLKKGPGQALSALQREFCYQLFLQGTTVRDISAALEREHQVKCSPATVTRLVKPWREDREELKALVTASVRHQVTGSRSVEAAVSDYLKQLDIEAVEQALAQLRHAKSLAGKSRQGLEFWLDMSDEAAGKVRKLRKRGEKWTSKCVQAAMARILPPMTLMKIHDMAQQVVTRYIHLPVGAAARQQTDTELTVTMQDPYALPPMPKADREIIDAEALPPAEKASSPPNDTAPPKG